jgi:CheY-like chemotaxis protein
VGLETTVSRLSILVVEDEVSMRDVLTDILSAAGHDVYGAPNGFEALHLLAAQEFDAILCDVRMPKMDGMALYAEIGKGWPHLLPRVVFVTGYAGQVDVDAFLARSRARVIVKPPNRDALLAALEQLSSER